MSETKREQIQREALNAALHHKRAGLHISMGVGKTYIGLQYINKFFDKFDKKILIVAPKVSIFESWKNDAEKFGLQHLLERIEFVTYISLNKKEPEDYGIVILDEAHTTKSSHEDFLWEFQDRILGLTGTPPRYANSEKGEMMEDYYPIVYSYSVNEAVDEEILNDYKIFIHRISLDNNNTIPVNTSNGSFYTSEAKNYSWLINQISTAVTEKQVFMKRIFMLNAMKKFASKVRFAKFISKSISSDEKCLLFANTTEQADQLCEYSHHSKNDKGVNKKNLDMFASGQVSRLSAVEQLSEGVTIPRLKHIVIMHSYGNEKKASQKIGRALRLNKDETSSVHILCYKDTVDEDWVEKALSDFDESKIKWINWKLVNNQYVKL
jgi:superfamily II DNA or RNA helicase